MLALVRHPLELMDRIIEMGSDPGGHVICPRDVSASVAVSASRLGRRWTIGTNLRGDPDLFVVELRVNRGDPHELYCTGSGKYYMKTESGNRHLVGRPQKEELRRRMPP
jgi:DNA modification methylase